MNLVIVSICLLILFVYNRTRNYLSLWGLLLYSLFLLVTFLKLRNVGNLSDLGFRLDNIQAALLPIALFVSAGIVILISMSKKPRNFKVLSWTISLAGLYLVFGITQQFFFQSVFSHSLWGFLGNKALVIILSGLFFAAFHWGKGLRFGFLTMVAGDIMTYLFLVNPNIILLGSAHAILASIYYYWVDVGDVFNNRFSLKYAGTSRS